jgi:hypothetical protein
LRRRDDITITVYAPPLTGGDARPAAIIRAMERAFPGVLLSWTVVEKRLVPLAQLRVDADGTFSFACNGDERRPVMISGWTVWHGPDQEAILEVYARIPLGDAGVASAVLAAIGDEARGFWGHATPFAAGAAIARQVDGRPHDPEPPPHGLPLVRHPREMPSPEIPYHLGWWNYWSAAAARAVGFPDPERDAELLARARSTSTGGWVLRLTDAPLDLDNPAHLDTLLRAYERFPEIGGRAGGQFAEPRGMP